MAKVKKLRQSLSKSYQDYKLGLDCGEKIKRIYIDGEYSEPSSAQRLGLYFEWTATNGGRETKALFNKSGSKMLIDYERATKQAENFKQDILSLGITIKEVSLKLENDFLTGEFDLLCEWEGRTCIIDLKYSGLYNDRYSPFGWNVETLPESYKMIQAKQYKLLATEKFGKEIDFYYFVFNSKNEQRKLIKVNCDKEALIMHSQDSFDVLDMINKEDLKPLPSFDLCNSCQFKDCIYKKTTPDIYEIQL